MQEKNIDLERLASILKKVEEIYVQAAEKGYVHGDPIGSTIMVDSQDQPYLTDWYLYSRGSIELDEEIKRKYLSGLDKIFEVQQKIMAISN
jgi:RIO-like serine/threonine protein kinase